MNSNPSLQRDDFMLRRFKQVARTYLHISFSIEVPALLATIILVNWLQPRSIQGRLGWAAISIYQASLAAMTVAGHLKSQLNDWRSSLTPGFRAPHILISGLAVAALILLFPLAIFAPLGMSAAGTIALTMVVSVSLAWALYSPLAAIVFGVGTILLFTHVSQDFIAELGQGARPAAATATITACAAALIVLWACFFRMDGTQQTYPNQPHDIHLRARMTRNPAGRQPGVLERWGDWAFDRMAHVPKPANHLGGAWSVVQQRRLVALQGMPPVFTGALFVLLIGAVLLVIQLITGFLTDPSDAQGGCAMLFISAMAWPILIVSIFLPGRWLNLGGELLLPAARRDFIRQIGLASAIDLVTLWVSSVSTALIVCALWWPHVTYNGFHFIAAALAASAASLVFNYGLLVWLTRLRHGVFSAAAVMLATTASVVPLMEPMPDLKQLNVTHLAVWIITLVGIGTLLTLDAYRRWCNTELD